MVNGILFGIAVDIDWCKNLVQGVPGQVGEQNFPANCAVYAVGAANPGLAGAERGGFFLCFSHFRSFFFLPGYCLFWYKAYIPPR